MIRTKRMASRLLPKPTTGLSKKFNPQSFPATDAGTQRGRSNTNAPIATRAIAPIAGLERKSAARISWTRASSRWILNALRFKSVCWRLLARPFTPRMRLQSRHQLGIYLFGISKKVASLSRWIIRRGYLECAGFSRL